MEFLRRIGYDSVSSEATPAIGTQPVHGVSNYTLNRIFVSGFDEMTTENELESAFEIYGEILDVNIVRSMESRLYGFVTFRYRQHCEAILKKKAIFAVKLRGNQLVINPAWYRPRRNLATEAVSAQPQLLTMQHQLQQSDWQHVPAVPDPNCLLCRQAPGSCMQYNFDTRTQIFSSVVNGTTFFRRSEPVSAGIYNNIYQSPTPVIFNYMPIPPENLQYL